MTQKFLWRGVFVVALCVILAIPARAQQNSLNNIGRNIVIGIVAVAAALVVIAIQDAIRPLDQRRFGHFAVGADEVVQDRVCSPRGDLVDGPET